LKLTIDEALRGLSVTAELLVYVKLL